jgi:transmembrane sensor
MKSIKSKIIRYLDGDISPSDTEEIFIWINQSRNNLRYFTELKNIWEASVSNESKIAGTREEWERLMSVIRQKERTRQPGPKEMLKAVYKVAAILVTGMLIGGAGVWLSSRSAPEYMTATAPRGSISQFVLPDSTQIYLNAGSELKYTLGKNRNLREVSLDGEAWFHVSKQKNRPFIVHTSMYDVRVLGTEFNVKAYGSDAKIVTTLEQGSLLITPRERLSAFPSFRLSPDEQFIYNRLTNSLHVSNVNSSQYSAWRDNKLVFLNLSLQELIVVLERKYGVTIEADSSDILKYHYHGTLKNETIIEVLEMVKKTLPIDYSIRDNKIRIISQQGNSQP